MREQRKQRRGSEWVWKRREGDRRELKGPDYGVSWRIQRVAQQLSSEIPTPSADDSRKERPARAEAVSTPAASQRPEKTVLQCSPHWLRRGIVQLFARQSRVPFQAFKKAKIDRTMPQRWPAMPNTKAVISRRAGGTLLCTSLPLAARFWIFIYILIYFCKKPSLVQRREEDESVMLYRKHDSAW